MQVFIPISLGPFPFNSLVHIKNINKSLIQIHDLLDSDGKFILCFPHILQDPEEIKDYSKEQIIKTNTQFGIVSQYHRPISFYINKLIKTRFIISKVYEFPSKKPSFFIIECLKAM